jgi:hypothetical protein
MNGLRPQPGGFKRTNEGLDWRYCDETLLGVVLDRSRVHLCDIFVTVACVEIPASAVSISIPTAIDVNQAMKTSQPLFCSLV